MKPLRLFVLFAFFLSWSHAAEEKLFDQLALAKTDFAITLNDISLQVENQGITLRAVSEKISYSNLNLINDYAYRAYHLEFAFKQKYKVRDGFEVIEFFEGNDLLHTIEIKSPSRKIATPNGRRYETNFIAVSLEGIPLVMLDSVDKINFRRSK